MPISKIWKLSQPTALIVLLISAFVMLTATIWQIKITHKAQDNFNNKMAVTLANDIANRMYLNYQEFIKGKTSIYLKQFVPGHKSLIEELVNYSCEHDHAGCDPLTIAAHDLTYWKQAIQHNLPNGRGKILWSTSHDNILIQINWGPSNKHQKGSKVYTTSIWFPYQLQKILKETHEQY